MTSRQTAWFLTRSACQVLASESAGGTDRDLLARFAEGDQAAFELLVARHTGMVLGVCRRVLPTLQDAEDACQATFLILARKASCGGWQSSVANWLYTTARRVADRARRSAARRVRREGRAAIPESTPASDPLTARELLAALDEELDRLPAHYREPLVLCYLEGLTRDETAVRLGVPVGTVKTRLERGRRRLEAALTRRGLGLGVGLLTAAVVNPVAVSSPGLSESILSSVIGSPPTAVAELAREFSMGRSVRVVSAVVVGFAVVAGLGYGWAASGAGGEKPSPAARANLPIQKEDRLHADINAARKKAIAFLKDRQKPDGTWAGTGSAALELDMKGGVTALTALSLLEAGVPANDQAVSKAVAGLAEQKFERTYLVSLQTQVLARVDAKKYANVIQRNADWLVKNAIGLGEEGGLQGWSYPVGPNPRPDGSNTHYAVLGLHAAAQAGTRVDEKVWDAVRDHYVSTRTDAGWSYIVQIPGLGRPTYSMTAAALVGLLVADCHHKPTPESRKTFERGMAALPTLKDRPTCLGYNLMVTAGLGRLTGTDVFKAGDQEVYWYRDRAKQLVTDQNPDGSWSLGQNLDADPVLATAFALYFLGPERKQ
jgi:RNA polymerase sigma factor (sigma-70 family)